MTICKYYKFLVEKSEILLTFNTIYVEYFAYNSTLIVLLILMAVPLV